MILLNINNFSYFAEYCIARIVYDFLITFETSLYFYFITSSSKTHKLKADTSYSYNLYI